MIGTISTTRTTRTSANCVTNAEYDAVAIVTLHVESSIAIILAKYVRACIY